MFRLLQNNCPDSCIFLSSGPTEGKSNDHITPSWVRILLPAPTKDWLWTESVKEFFCSDIPPGGGREKDSRKTIVSRKRKITIRTKTPRSSNRSFPKVPQRVQHEETGARFSRILSSCQTRPE